MKIIGLIGGLTWHSSIDYYRYINQLVNEKTGGDDAAKMILYSVNYGEIKRLTLAGDWDTIAEIIGTAAQKTEQAGAACIMLGANTMHHIAEKVQAKINVPLIHIADATGKAIREKGLSNVLLLGTRFTMLYDFYRDRLASQGITAQVPDAAGVEMINNSIYEELGKGILLPETKQRYLTLIQEHVGNGAQGVILGCTEIPLLIKQEDSPVPVFDTTYLHAKAAVEFAMG